MIRSERIYLCPKNLYLSSTQNFAIPWHKHARMTSLHPGTERVNKEPSSFQRRKWFAAKGWSRRWEREGTHSGQCPGGSADAQRWQPVQLQTPGASGTCSVHTHTHKSTVKKSKQNGSSCPLTIMMLLPRSILFFR